MRYLKTYKLFLESNSEEEIFPELFKRVSDILGSKTDNIEDMLDNLDEYLEFNDEDMIASKLYDDLYNVYLDIEAAHLIEKIESKVDVNLKELDIQLLYDKVEELSLQEDISDVCSDLLEVIQELDMLDGEDDINESKSKKKRSKARKERNKYDLNSNYNRGYYPFGYFNNFLRPYSQLWNPGVVNNNTYNTTNNDNSIDINAGGDVNIGDISTGDIG